MSDAICLKHHFLLAMPGLVSDYFGNTITYVCEHNESGAMGLMINRPMELPLSKLLEQLEIDVLVKLQVPVLEGGPVGSDHGFVLHTDDYRSEHSIEVGEGLTLTATRDVLEAMAAARGHPRRSILALGYAGWGAGQLENEIKENVWLTCEPDETLIFDGEHERKWTKALAKLGIDPGLLSSAAGRA